MTFYLKLSAFIALFAALAALSASDLVRVTLMEPNSPEWSEQIDRGAREIHRQQGTDAAVADMEARKEFGPHGEITFRETAEAPPPR